jgi:hypothetical protein
MQTQICTVLSIVYGNAFDSVPVHTPGDSGDGHALFGGVGQRKGVPEPNAKNGKEIDVDKKPMKDPHHGLINVPPGRINTRPNAGRAYEEVAPFCVSANDLINPLPPSLFYGSGWFAYHPSTSAGSSLQTAAHYWYSSLPTSKLRIPIQVGAGDIGIYYLKEPVPAVGEGSSVECWVDDNYGGAKVIDNAADVRHTTWTIILGVIVISLSTLTLLVPFSWRIGYVGRWELYEYILLNGEIVGCTGKFARPD